jgi:hypothetical protein
MSKYWHDEASQNPEKGELFVPPVRVLEQVE